MKITEYYEREGRVDEFDCDKDAEEEIFEIENSFDFPLYISIDGVLYKKKDDFNRSKQ